MLSPNELAQAQAEVEEAAIAEMRYELAMKLRQHIVDWARQTSDNLSTAAYSMVNGRWDDIPKDLYRGRITKEQAVSLLDELLKCRLITNRQHEWYSQKWTEGQSYGYDTNEIREMLGGVTRGRVSALAKRLDWPVIGQEGRLKVYARGAVDDYLRTRDK